MLDLNNLFTLFPLLGLSRASRAINTIQTVLQQWVSGGKKSQINQSGFPPTPVGPVYETGFGGTPQPREGVGSFEP